MQDEREPARIQGRHEGHPAARVIDDGAQVGERRGYAGLLAPNQPTFEVRQRFTRAFDLLRRGRGGPVCDQSIRILRIVGVEQPGGAERIGGVGMAGRRLQDESFQAVKRSTSRIDADVFIEFANRIGQSSALHVQRRQRRMDLQRRLDVVHGLQSRPQFAFGVADLPVPSLEGRRHRRQLGHELRPLVAVETTHRSVERYHGGKERTTLGERLARRQDEQDATALAAATAARSARTACSATRNGMRPTTPSPSRTVMTWLAGRSSNDFRRAARPAYLQALGSIRGAESEVCTQVVLGQIART